MLCGECSEGWAREQYPQQCLRCFELSSLFLTASTSDPFKNLNNNSSAVQRGSEDSEGGPATRSRPGRASRRLFQGAILWEIFQKATAFAERFGCLWGGLCVFFSFSEGLDEGNPSSTGSVPWHHICPPTGPLRPPPEPTHTTRSRFSRTSPDLVGGSLQLRGGRNGGHGRCEGQHETAHLYDPWLVDLHLCRLVGRWDRGTTLSRLVGLFWTPKVLLDVGHPQPVGFWVCFSVSSR